MPPENSNIIYRHNKVNKLFISFKTTHHSHLLLTRFSGTLAGAIRHLPVMVSYPIHLRMRSIGDVAGVPF